MALVTGLVAAHYGRAIRALRADALRRLHDPAAPASSMAATTFAVRATAELAELSETLDALHLRVRVADDVADRHRRMAQTTSAGMFELLSGLVEAEESARGQLAAELHDTVAQTLMLARGRLANPSGTSMSAAAVEEAAELLSDAEEQVRAVMARTRPPALRDGDLALAVANLRADMEFRYGMRVSVEWPQIAHPLPLVTAITIYRFLQEALLNVVKHAEVDEAAVTLVVDEHGVAAMVHDDGPGFDPARVRSDRGRHVGLGLLRERARLAGGSLEVASWSGQGTTLSLRLPRVAAGSTHRLDPLPERLA